ncbi:hypothetical protein PHMEG_00020201 [Phytophthora megakarya]|uniref:Uncharacterized protein n=1 Tax=Phytophthora megakarya TaxID=4795 RepID=A0A225VPQ4_9STRA|nr:hypothetical protein PHMEG_00020201 [Phytophthora megakarya]
MGTYVIYVPAGSTSVAPPLDIGVMAPVMMSLNARYTELHSKTPPRCTTSQRRYDIFPRSMSAIRSTTTNAIKNLFIKTRLLTPFGPPVQPTAVEVSATEIIV